MRRTLTIFAAAAGVLAALGHLQAVESRWELSSPGDTAHIAVVLKDGDNTAGYPAGRLRLYYQVEQGKPNAKATVIAWSPLGLVRADQDFLDGLRFVVFLGCFLVGSSRVDLQACKLEYSIVSPK